MAMNCETFKQNINAYLDGELMLDEKCEMELHAAECEACARLLDEASGLNTLLAELGDEVVVPLNAQAAWRRAVRAEAKKKRPSGAWIRTLGTVAAALVVAVVSTLGANQSDSLPAMSQPIDDGMMVQMTFAGRPERNDWRMSGTDVFVLTGNMLHSDGSVENSRGESDVQQEAAIQPKDAEYDTLMTAAQEIRPVVLRSAKRGIESKNYDRDVAWLEDLVSEYGAYFEERTETFSAENGQGGRVIDASVRVPVDRLDDFLTELDQLGNAVLKSESQEDVTGEYMDAQSRLNALAAQKAKLEEMMASATDVAELIAVDDKMADVIASMEALEGDLRRWESRQSYSAVSIRLTEVVEQPIVPAATLNERMKTAFDESVVWLGEFGQNALVVLSGAAPRLVIWIPAAALVVVLLCVIVRKRRK